MVTKKMQTALNKQLKLEQDSSYLYLSMSNWCVEQNLLGFANWMKVQAGEEQEHAMKIYKFLQDNNVKVVLDNIDKPKASWKSPREMFENVLAHEQSITKSIHNLYTLAKSENDYASEVMLHWFINEQVEEEASANEVLQKIIMIGDKSTAIWWVDKELKKRGA